MDNNISKNYNVSLPEVAEMLAECCYRCLGLNIMIMTGLVVTIDEINNELGWRVDVDVMT